MDSGPRPSASPWLVRSLTSGALPISVLSYRPWRISSWVMLLLGWWCCTPAAPTPWPPPAAARAPARVGRADEVTAVDLAQVLDAERCGHRQVDRLLARVGQAPQRVGGELDQIAVADPAAGQAHHHRPRPQRPAGAVALHERVPL